MIAMTGNNSPRLDRVYAAIADPTRRAILAQLSEGHINVGDLAARFPISLNGVSKHVKVLERAGLLQREILGREHQLQLRAEPLREAEEWFQRYRAFWTARLDALEHLLAQPTPPASAGRGGHRTKTKHRSRD
jgi:DNA-binding transcriptional ArsR family regulator